MKKLFDCEIFYVNSPHLSQIYNGFDKLKQQGVINLKYNISEGNPKKPILKVILNKKYTILYDTLDGLNWIEDSLEENLMHFKHKINADFCFKRSFNDLVFNNAPENCCVFPLGLNYYLTPPTQPNKKKDLKSRIKTSNLYKIIKKPEYDEYLNLNSNTFESYPIRHTQNKIIFFTRLWDPDKVNDIELKNEREIINNVRINTIKTCKKEFNNLFIGGIYEDDFSKKQAPNLIASKMETNKLNYLENVKNSNICIGTTGLHGSIGWKLGEYVASSKAIITEPLNYKLPGDFLENKNYLSFSDDKQLVSKINLLVNDKEYMYKLMHNNYNYYNNYLKSDKLILNTLLTVYNETT